MGTKIHVGKATAFVFPRRTVTRRAHINSYVTDAEQENNQAHPAGRREVVATDSNLTRTPWATVPQFIEDESETTAQELQNSCLKATLFDEYYRRHLAQLNVPLVSPMEISAAGPSAVATAVGAAQCKQIPKQGDGEESERPRWTSFGRPTRDWLVSVDAMNQAEARAERCKTLARKNVQKRAPPQRFIASVKKIDDLADAVTKPKGRRRIEPNSLEQLPLFRGHSIAHPWNNPRREQERRYNRGMGGRSLPGGRPKLTPIRGVASNSAPIDGSGDVSFMRSSLPREIDRTSWFPRLRKSRTTEEVGRTTPNHVPTQRDRGSTSRSMNAKGKQQKKLSHGTLQQILDVYTRQQKRFEESMEDARTHAAWWDKEVSAVDRHIQLGSTRFHRRIWPEIPQSLEVKS